MNALRKPGRRLLETPWASESGRWSAKEFALDAPLLVGLKLAIGACVLFAGFSHVSDDDYARTVIAEQFAHAPRLDPSGTSWLPLPFWLTGAVMAVGGRSLATARAVAIGLGGASVLAPYAAMRTVGMRRLPAALATAVGMALPWNAWLGVATVPEAWSGALLAAAVIAITHDKARPWAAAAVFAASLSRYEAWPACATCAAFCIACALRENARRPWAWAAVALAGPLLWMGWNAVAHGSAFHFLARVSTFRRATGAANLPLRDKLLGYPRALLSETPEVVLLGAIGAFGLTRSPLLRARWRWSAAAAMAVLVFLIEGDVSDGAPTHHPERALAALWWVLTAMGIDALAQEASRWQRAGRRAVAVAIAITVAAWSASLPTRWKACPGNTEGERREPQIARGNELRARRVPSAAITPCAYEHFALLAAWGEPERARLEPSLHRPPGPDCPRVLEP